VLGIDAGGGGIYVHAALQAAGLDLVSADGAAVRHLLLFADAADAEEPGEYERLLAEYRALGITVSVIALGGEDDIDAALLRDIAARGGGRCHFAGSAADLPRLFAQETVVAAQSAWRGEP